MSRPHRWAAGAGALILLLAGPLPGQNPPQRPPSISIEDTARFLSGLPCDSEHLRGLQATSEGREFMAAMDRSWADLEAKRLKPMREWAASELAEAWAETRTLFYPFGGPDFLTAFELFPAAETYILLGLELVGRLPDPEELTPARAADYSGSVRSALSDFINKSYFITRNMNTAFGGNKVDGVLPILCLFLERTGHRITALKRCEFLPTGELMESAFLAPAKRLRRPYGAKVEFQAGGAGPAKSLYYFSCDLVDGVFKEESVFHRHLEALPFETTFIKSASYLMHYANFSRIRGLVLDKSRSILQDDTGIPWRFFKPETWQARLYGEYIKPVKDFSGVEQEDLKAAYADPGSDVRKLPFHLGYHWGTNKDSFQYFRRKGETGAGR